MATSETNVDVRIRSISEKQGFAQAQQGIDQLSKKAGAATPKVGKLGAATKDLGTSSAISGARVGGMTQALLRSIGAQTGMTEASIGAGAAVDGMAGKMALANVAIAGGAVAIAVLIPLLINWFNASKKVKEEQLKVRDAMLSMLEQLETYVATVPRATKEMREFAKALRDAALLKQSAEIKKLEGDIETLLEEQLRLNSTMERQNEIVRGTVKVSSSLANKLAENKKRSKELEIQIALQLGKFNQLLIAQRGGVLLSERIASGTRDATEASAERAKALETEKKAQEELNAALKEGANFIDQAALARDGQALADLEAKKARGALTEEGFRALTQFDSEARARREGERTRQEIERQERLDVTANNAFLLAEGTAAATAFFGNNKAARIAQALADTAAGATRAFADLPPPANFAVAAAITAAGLANVAAIRKTEIGFDNPINDRLAESFGERFAVDMVSRVNSGFQRMLGQFGGGGGTTIDRSMNFSGPINVGGGGVSGGSRRRILLQLERELISVRRLENRTRIPR